MLQRPDMHAPDVYEVVVVDAQLRAPGLENATVEVAEVRVGGTGALATVRLRERLQERLDVSARTAEARLGHGRRYTGIGSIWGLPCVSSTYHAALLPFDH
jgi:hypothetical protein